MNAIIKFIQGVLLTLVFPFTALAQSTTILYDFKSDGLCFRKLNDSKVAICPESETVTSDGQAVYQGNNDFYTSQLPTTVNDEEYNYYSVTAIDPHAFENTDIRSVVIPDTYSSIGEYAFSGCSDLKYVVIGNYTGGFADSDITIEPGAFYSTPNLSSVFLCTTTMQNAILVNQDGSDAFSGESQIRSDFKIFAVRPSSYSISTWSNYIIYKFGNFENCTLTYNGETQVPTPVYNSEVEGFQTTIGQYEPTMPDEGKDVGTYGGLATISFLAGAPYYLNFSIKQEYNYSIKPASLTISTPHLIREYGQPNPEIEISVIGYVGNDNEDIFSTRPIIVNGMESQWSPLPDETSNVGIYPIYVMAVQNYPENYELHYEDGSITVEQASQIITWDQIFTDCTVGQEVKLTATATSGLEISYESSNPDIAVIDGKMIKFLSEGEVIVKALQPGNDNYLSAQTLEKYINISPRLIDKLYFDEDEIELKEGESCQLIVSWEPSDAESPELIWSSSYPEYASVDNTGIVNGLTQGETIITVSLKDNPDVFASCKVTVGITSGLEEVISYLKTGFIIENNKLIITSNPTSPITIWSVDGKVIYFGLEKEIPMKDGIYILHFNGKSFKIKI